MNASPHGASVVPTVATAARTPSRVSGSPPATSPCAAAPQSGWARKPGHDVGHEDRAEREQHVLDPAEAALEHEHAHGQRRERHADVAARAGEHLHPGRDAGELRADRPDVRDDERGQREVRTARAVALAHEPHQALAGDDARAHGELVEDDQRHRRQREHPQQPVAVVGAEDRVGRDARPGRRPTARRAGRGPGRRGTRRSATRCPRRRPSARCGARRTRCGRGRGISRLRGPAARRGSVAPTEHCCSARCRA